MPTASGKDGAEANLFADQSEIYLGSRFCWKDANADGMRALCSRAHCHCPWRDGMQAPCPQIHLSRPRLVANSYLRKSPSTSALAFSNPFGSTLSHVESGSNWVMAVARSAVFSPRSFLSSHPSLAAPKNITTEVTLSACTTSYIQ